MKELTVKGGGYARETGDPRHIETFAKKGPSDTRAARGYRRRGGETFARVDYLGASKDELQERGKNLDVKGRSRMNKRELAEAIAKKQS
ncbi:MAG: hypothetical protein C4521_01385 [Actinobacteria bacterium]|nr:MAG: hypothetical protein C4521_01385 [Actinomycetota bacterium]